MTTTDLTTVATTVPASVPMWVPLLLLGLLALGWRQSRDRLVRPGVLIGVAVGMLLLSWSGLRASLGTEPATVAAWLAGMAVTLLAGGRLMGLQGLQKEGGRVRLPGSWWPMALFLTIFGVRFVLGWAKGVHSPLLDSAWFVALCAVLLGGCSGAFSARALAVRSA